MARTSRGKLVGINEEPTVGITRVKGQHPVEDILLCTLRLVTRSQKSASRIGSLTSLQPSGLGVIVVSIRVVSGNVLEDDTPKALNIDSPLQLGIVDMGGAKIALRSNPVANIIRTGSLGSTGIVIIVEAIFLKMLEKKLSSELVLNNSMCDCIIT
jgi:hypothetical protein